MLQINLLGDAKETGTGITLHNTNWMYLRCLYVVIVKKVFLELMI